MSVEKQTPDDGRVKAEVVASDVYGSAERFTLRIRPRDAQIGQTVWVIHPDGTPEAYVVAGILEDRQRD